MVQLAPYAQRTNPCTDAPFIVVEVATVLKISFIFVAELVAVVTTHAAVTVEVAACAFKSVRFASAVTLPDIAVVLADEFLMVSPALSVNWVVDAPPRNVARPVTPTVLERVAAPETVSKSLVNLPDKTVELADAFLMVSPERSVN